MMICPVCGAVRCVHVGTAFNLGLTSFTFWVRNLSTQEEAGVHTADGRTEFIGIWEVGPQPGEQQIRDFFDAAICATVTDS